LITSPDEFWRGIAALPAGVSVPTTDSATWCLTPVVPWPSRADWARGLQRNPSRPLRPKAAIWRVDDDLLRRASASSADPSPVMVSMPFLGRAAITLRSQPDQPKVLPSLLPMSRSAEMTIFMTGSPVAIALSPALAFDGFGSGKGLVEAVRPCRARKAYLQSPVRLEGDAARFQALMS